MTEDGSIANAATLPSKTLRTKAYDFVERICINLVPKNANFKKIAIR
jgi:hypothetical protein